MPFKRILIPVDYSQHSRAALDYAARLAARSGAELTIVHVWDRPSYVTDAVLVGHGTSQRPLGELIRENAEHDMKEFLQSAPLPVDIQRRELLLSGDPASALLKHLETEPYDLVVLGTHGRAGFAHLLLGSVAEKLVRHSPIPVLTIPKRALSAGATPADTGL